MTGGPRRFTSAKFHLLRTHIGSTIAPDLVVREVLPQAIVQSEDSTVGSFDKVALFLVTSQSCR